MFDRQSVITSGVPFLKILGLLLRGAACEVKITKGRLPVFLAILFQRSLILEVRQQQLCNEAVKCGPPSSVVQTYNHIFSVRAQAGLDMVCI